MTDNFNLFKQYILDAVTDFDGNSDKYYVIELIRRGKDNPDMPAANYHFKNYYINKVSDVDKYKDEIVNLCKLLNLRAYFSVNYKSYKQVLMNMVAESANRVASHDFKKPYAIYESCSGKYFDNSNKVWLVDVDSEDAEGYGMTVDELSDNYVRFINECKPNKGVIMTVPTRSGKHLLCHPFDISNFNKICNEWHFKEHNEKAHSLIKKNHVSLLYEDIN